MATLNKLGVHDVLLVQAVRVTWWVRSQAPLVTR